MLRKYKINKHNYDFHQTQQGEMIMQLKEICKSKFGINLALDIIDNQ
ncbi:hypothetical protein pb186bvf_019421 [Paramecium bursaria]